MLKRNRSRSTSGPAVIEGLESRELYSVATTTTITPNATSFIMGQTIDMTIKVAAASGPNAPRGRVALYTSKILTPFVVTLSSKGVAHIILNPGYALSPNTYTFTVRYRPSNASFDSSVSKKFVFTVSFPPEKAAKTHSNGLVTAIVIPGTGTATVARHNVITFEATGYDSNGNLVSENETHTPSTSQLTVDAHPEQVVPGLDQGILGMKVGEVRLIQIPSALGNNDGLTLLYIVHVIAID